MADSVKVRAARLASVTLAEEVIDRHARDEQMQKYPPSKARGEGTRRRRRQSAKNN